MDITIVYKTFHEKQAFAKAYELIQEVINIQSLIDTPHDIAECPKIKTLIRQLGKWSAVLVSMDGGL